MLIKVDLNKMRTFSNSAQSIGLNMTQISGNLRSLSNSLEWEVKASSNINNILKKSYTEAEKQAKVLSEMSKFLSTANKQYTDIEKEISSINLNGPISTGVVHGIFNSIKNILDYLKSNPLVQVGAFPGGLGYLLIKNLNSSDSLTAKNILDQIEKIKYINTFVEHVGAKAVANGLGLLTDSRVRDWQINAQNKITETLGQAHDHINRGVDRVGDGIIQMRDVGRNVANTIGNIAKPLDKVLDGVDLGVNMYDVWSGDEKFSDKFVDSGEKLGEWGWKLGIGVAATAIAAPFIAPTLAGGAVALGVAYGATILGDKTAKIGGWIGKESHKLILDGVDIVKDTTSKAVSKVGEITTNFKTSVVNNVMGWTKSLAF